MKATAWETRPLREGSQIVECLSDDTVIGEVEPTTRHGKTKWTARSFRKDVRTSSHVSYSRAVNAVFARAD